MGLIVLEGFVFRQGHLNMVVLLMAYGADPSVRDGEGRSSTNSSTMAWVTPAGDSVYGVGSLSSTDHCYSTICDWQVQVKV